MNFDELLAQVWPKLELFLKKLMATIQELFGGSAEE